MTLSAKLGRVRTASFSGRSLRPASIRPVAPVSTRFVVRAEETSEETAVTETKDRVEAKDELYFASKQSLSYLDGSLPGDFGFDPLGLSDPEGEGGYINPSWLAYAEVLHGRWAMLGAAGCMTPEILGKAGFIPESTGLVWFKSGVIPPQGQFDYWCDPYTLFFVEMVLMSFAEHRRIQDFRKPGSMGESYFLGMEGAFGGSGNPAYPGGQFFNMLNLGKEDMDLMKLREIKNGRLAMVAMLGIFVQAAFTGEGPYQNLLDHLENGLDSSIFASFGAVGGPGSTW